MALDHTSPEYQAFLEAVKNGQIADVEQHLTELPEFLDLADNHGRRPLHRAAENGRDSMVELLLQRGSSTSHIDSTTRVGMTPLHYAAENGHDSTVELFLQCGSTSLDSITRMGMTPLHLAARN